MRPIVISIAGFDPSGGAGILADIKTFEQIGVTGFGVCSAITYQREDFFDNLEWLPWKKIKKQLDILLEKHQVEYCKIGIIKNTKTLKKTCRYLNKKDIKIIYDPVVSSSTGFEFNSDPESIQKTLDKIYLLTPNKIEYRLISGKKKITSSKHYNILLKGGHNKKNKGVDKLYENKKKTTLFPRKGNHYPKHGSGCILSSAITAYLALGNDLKTACIKGKEYTADVLKSNSGLLGYHHSNVDSFYSITKKNKNIFSNVDYKIQYISQGDIPEEHLQNIKRALDSGCKWIQLRLKDSNRNSIKSTAKVAIKLCKKHNAIFILNDHVGIAKEIKAHGVHLGKQDMHPSDARKILGKKTIIGGTANTWEDIERLIAAKVNYIGLGPFRFTNTKKNLSPILGLKGYREIMDKMKNEKKPIPVFAIGGIVENDIYDLLKTDISGIAVSGLITKSKNPEQLIHNIKNLFHHAEVSFI